MAKKARTRVANKTGKAAARRSAKKSAKKAVGKAGRASRTGGPPIRIRYRWVCESGHTRKQAGPYTPDYEKAVAGGHAHDQLSHKSVPTATIETSATP